MISAFHCCVKCAIRGENIDDYSIPHAVSIDGAWRCLRLRDDGVWYTYFCIGYERDVLRMIENWLRAAVRWSAFVHKEKARLFAAQGFGILWHAFYFTALEASLLMFSLPLHLFVDPDVIIKKKIGHRSHAKHYQVRRALSLALLASSGFLYVAVFVLGVVGVSVFPQASSASTAQWDFDSATEYIHDANAVEIVDGVVVFKASAPVYSAQSVSDEVVPSSAPDTAPVSDVSPAPAVDAGEPLQRPHDPSPLVETPTLDSPPTPVVAPSDVLPSGDTVTSSSVDSEVPSVLTPEAIVPPAEQRPSSLCQTVIQPTQFFQASDILHWTGFREAATKNGGEIAYQLSHDGGLTWLWWDGTSWSDAGRNNFNTAAQVNAHIAEFPLLDTQSGTILFNAQLTSDCTRDMELLTIAVDYESVPKEPLAGSDADIAALDGIELQNTPETTPARNDGFVDVNQDVLAEQAALVEKNTKKEGGEEEKSQSGHYLVSVRSDLEVTNPEGKRVDTTSKGVYVGKKGINVGYLELSKDIDLSDQLFDQSPQRAWLSLSRPSLDSISYAELIVSRSDLNASIGVCPSASDISAVESGCAGETHLSKASPAANGYRLVKLTDGNYWHIRLPLGASFSAGAFEIDPAPTEETPNIEDVPTPSPPSSGDPVSQGFLNTGIGTVLLSVIQRGLNAII